MLAHRIAVSRAFVKETDAPEPRCPSRQGCEGLGVPVGAATLQAQLSPERAAALAPDAYYCPNPLCAVAYFDAEGGVALRAEQRRRSWPKESGAPVCVCFGVSEDEIAAWAHAPDAPDKASMRALLARIDGPQARCATEAPDGRPCTTAVRRVFLRELEARA